MPSPLRVPLLAAPLAVAMPAFAEAMPASPPAAATIATTPIERAELDDDRSTGGAAADSNPDVNPVVDRGVDRDPAGSPANVPAYAATEAYEVRNIRGWTVRVSPDLAASPGLRDAVLDLLDNHLFRIGRVVPAPALERLRQVEIWAETEMPKTACMCYHVSKGWLVPNGYNPDKEGTVEIGNAVAFLRWTKHQPWMVLHELAHAYHDQVLGYRHAGLEAAWRRMAETGAYDEVGHIAGGTRRHYALTNPMEYFAETTEALFGTNDFHPYVRSELEAVDPEGFALVRSLWELDPVPEGPGPDAATRR